MKIILSLTPLIMKSSNNRNYFTLLFLVLFFIGNAQKISLAELHTICTNKNWETSNKYLISKGWDFYNSSVGDDEHYNTISWSFEKSRIDDAKASGWFYIYTYDGLPNKVIYRFRQKEYYRSLIQQIQAAAYKLEGEEINENTVVATYKNPKYIIELSYERVDEDEYSYGGSYTVYNLQVYKKGGIYDPNNGKKYDFDEYGNISASYFLKEGKIDGELNFFNPNGTIRRTISVKNGIENGLSTEYIYRDVNDSLAVVLGKVKGQVIDGKKTGKWQTILLKDDVEYELGYQTYVNDSRNGPFQKVINDTVIFSSYKNDMIEGKYTVFRDLKRMLEGSVAETDSTKLRKITTGFFSNNKRTGYWKNYDLTGTLISEGNYADSLKTGKWKYYNPKIIDNNNNDLDYSGKLYLEENYRNDKLNGECIRYSYFEDIEVPCDDDKEKICTEKKFIKILEKSNYLEDELNGSYEFLNDQNEILAKGNYLNGKENGKWLLKNESPVIKWKGITTEIGDFSYGKKQGEWNRYDDDNQLLEKYYYVNSQLEGEHLLFSKGRVSEKRKFLKDQMTDLKVLDNAENPITEYSLSDISPTKYTCKKTERAADGYYIKTYSVNRIANDIIPFTFKIDFELLSENIKTLDGFYQHESLDRKLIEEGNYKNNTKVGTWIYNYYDQNIKTEFDYNLYGIIQKESYFNIKKQEPFSGEFIYKTSNSDITEERKIKDGLRHGTTRFKDANDKTIKKESYKDGVLKE